MAESEIIARAVIEVVIDDRKARAQIAKLRQDYAQAIGGGGNFGSSYSAGIGTDIGTGIGAGIGTLSAGSYLASRLGSMASTGASTASSSVTVSRYAAMPPTQLESLMASSAAVKNFRRESLLAKYSGGSELIKTHDVGGIFGSRSGSVSSAMMGFGAKKMGAEAGAEIGAASLGLGKLAVILSKVAAGTTLAVGGLAALTVVLNRAYDWKIGAAIGRGVNYTKAAFENFGEAGERTYNEKTLLSSQGIDPYSSPGSTEEMYRRQSLGIDTRKWSTNQKLMFQFQAQDAANKKVRDRQVQYRDLSAIPGNAGLEYESGLVGNGGLNADAALSAGLARTLGNAQRERDIAQSMVGLMAIQAVARKKAGGTNEVYNQDMDAIFGQKMAVTGLSRGVIAAQRAVEENAADQKRRTIFERQNFTEGQSGIGRFQDDGRQYKNLGGQISQRRKFLQEQWGGMAFSEKTAGLAGITSLMSQQTDIENARAAKKPTFDSADSFSGLHGMAQSFGFENSSEQRMIDVQDKNTQRLVDAVKEVTAAIDNQDFSFVGP